ncbi:MAG: hypothetical protein WCK31_00825 [bacterium]
MNIDKVAMEGILKSANVLIQKSEIYDSSEKFNVFITNSDLMWRYFTNINSNVGGLNYVVFNGNIFIRKSDIPNNRIYGPSGNAVLGDRGLDYFIAHEITHSIEYNEIGIGRFPLKTNWVLEGYSEYIAHGSESYDESLRKYLNTPGPSYVKYYEKTKVMVAYLLGVEEVKLSDLWKMEDQYSSILVNAIPNDKPIIDDNINIW